MIFKNKDFQVIKPKMKLFVKRKKESSKIGFGSTFGVKLDLHHVV